MEWKPIKDAPRDGTLVKVGWRDETDEAMQEWFIMQWGHIQQNGLFPGIVGMWVAPDGSVTWQEEDGGPTHWKPLEPPND